MNTLKTVNQVRNAEDKYGGAAWDAAGGNFDATGQLGMDAVESYLGAKAANTFVKSGAQSTEGAYGAYLGALAGKGFLGPVGSAAGAILGGTLGNFVGAIRKGLTGNADKDFQFSQGGGDGRSFEGNLGFQTALGSIGLDAKGTRNVNNKEASAYLQDMQGYFTQLDAELAKGLTPAELASVRQDLTGFQVDNKNANQYGYEPVKALVKKRMEALKSTLSPERQKATGFDQLLADYNAQYDGLNQQQAGELQGLMTQFQSAKQTDVDSWDYRMSQEHADELQSQISNLSQQYMGRDITDSQGQDSAWYQPNGANQGWLSFSTGMGAQPFYKV